MEEILDFVIQFGSYFLFGIIVAILLKLIISSSIKEHHSHWNTLIDDFKSSPKEFYDLLKKEIYANGIKNVHMKEVRLKTGNVFSSSRLYLRIEWKEYQYDICAAPVGKGFFISYWLLYKNSIVKILIGKFPFIGAWLARKLFPVTYYKMDTASMFLSYCHSSVLKVLDAITNEKGLRSLSESERKPVLNNIFKR